MKSKRKKKDIKSPLLKKERKDRRTKWCLDHENVDWGNASFTDESSINNTVELQWLKYLRDHEN